MNVNTGFQDNHLPFPVRPVSVLTSDNGRMTVQRKLHWLWFEQPPNQVAGLESKFHTTVQTDEDTLAEQVLTQVCTNAALDKMAN